MICDTLNNKIKCVEVDGTRSAYSKTFIGSGKRGNNLIVNKEKNKGDKDKKESDEIFLKDIELNAPQGVAYDRNKKMIYVADTGNNRILCINRVSFAVKEMKFDFSKI